MIVVCAAIGLVACGSGSGASKEEIAHAERHARREKSEKEKERNLEGKIAKLEREHRLEKKHKRQREEEEREGAHVTPTPTPSVSPPEPSTPSGTDCGDGVIAGPETSCGFALNVRTEYENFIGSGSGTIEAYSEANEEIYSMFCTAAPHECSGAISATVYFP
jgi:hypothetical protein